MSAVIPLAIMRDLTEDISREVRIEVLMIRLRAQFRSLPPLSSPVGAKAGGAPREPSRHFFPSLMADAHGPDALEWPP